MNVLLVEDRGAIAFYVAEWLRQHGHVVLNAFNPYDAQNQWATREQVPIHCIILDLNMTTDGLKQKQKARSVGGLLSGWVWLYDFVLSAAPQMRQRTIIYSDYIATLKENVPEADYRGISLIPKRSQESAAKTLVARILEIARCQE